MGHAHYGRATPLSSAGRGAGPGCRAKTGSAAALTRRSPHSPLKVKVGASAHILRPRREGVEQLERKTAPGCEAGVVADHVDLVLYAARPIGLAGGMNLYGFAAGDPVNFSDPFGLCKRPGDLSCRKFRTGSAADAREVFADVGRRTSGMQSVRVGASATVGTIGVGCSTGPARGSEGCSSSAVANSPSIGASLDFGIKYRSAAAGEPGFSLSAGIGQHLGVTVTNETFMLNLGVSTPTVSPVTTAVDFPTITPPAGPTALETPADNTGVRRTPLRQ